MEMEPETAFQVASNKDRESGQPALVELTENVGWNPEWRRLL
jgi:hypothetical protein